MRTVCVTRPPARWARPVVVSLTLLAASCAASPARPSSEPPPDPVTERAAPTASDPVVTDEPFEWPSAGWFRLELDADLAVDETTVMRWDAVVAGVWDADRFEWWSDAPVDVGREGRHRDHGVDRGSDARIAIATRAGIFEAGRAAGLADEGVGPDGGRVFFSSSTEAGSTVEERWEIGTGPAPWSAEGPSAAGS